MKSPKSTKKAETRTAASLTKYKLSPARLVRQDCKITLAEVARLTALGNTLNTK